MHPDTACQGVFSAARLRRATFRGWPPVPLGTRAAANRSASSFDMLSRRASMCRRAAGTYTRGKRAPWLCHGDRTPPAAGPLNSTLEEGSILPTQNSARAAHRFKQPPPSSGATVAQEAEHEVRRMIGVQQRAADCALAGTADRSTSLKQHLKLEWLTEEEYLHVPGRAQSGGTPDDGGGCFVFRSKDFAEVLGLHTQYVPPYVPVRSLLHSKKGRGRHRHSSP